MFQQQSENTLLTFQDVVACFSQEEWELLHTWQKDLYANLMKEVQQVLTSLGPVIEASIFSLRKNEKERLCLVDVGNSDQRRCDDHSPSSAMSVLDVFTISREDAQCMKDPVNTDRGESSSQLSRESPDLLTGEELTIGVISASIKEEGEVYPLDGPNHEEGINVFCPTGVTMSGLDVFTISRKDAQCMKDPVNKDRRENPSPLSRESPNLLTAEEFTIGVISSSIKEEGKVYPLDGQNHEEGFPPLKLEPMGSYPDPVDGEGRAAGASVSSGMVDLASLTSSNIKEETEPSSMDHREFEIKESINNLKGCWLVTGSMNDKEANGYLLRKRSRIHNERCFACTECEKRFNKKSLLVAHQKLHADLTPYRRTECEREFSEKPSVLSHQRLHTVERLFHCTMCEKSFTHKAYLRVHERIHTGERPYHCTKCEKSFTQKTNLKCHQRTHTGERPFQCTTCEKSFTQKANLRTHQKIHTGTRPFYCTKCKIRFTLKANLQRHLKIHTGVRPFNCNECGKTFALKAKLDRHLTVHAKMKLFHCTE